MRIEDASRETRIPIPLLEKMLQKKLIVRDLNGDISVMSLQQALRSNAVLCQISRMRKELAAKTK
jgi:hypothetical protein